MHQLVNDYPDFFLAQHQAPCLSLYQPTHRSHPEKAQDPIRFRVLTKELETSLRIRYASHDISALLQPLDELANNREFWQQTGHGLVVLRTPELFRVYCLLRPVVERAVVADSFHIKPLIRIMQSADNFQILALNRKTFSVYEGNRDALQQLPPIDGVSYTAEFPLGRDADIRQRAHRAYGPSGTNTVAHHGTDVKQDAEHRDTQRFFRAVDETVLDHFSRPSGSRLILAALPQHHRLFRAISRNPYLMSDGIEANPDALTLCELRERAWTLMLPYYLKRLGRITEAFGAASSNERGADDLDAIAVAAADGRVETLLVEADRVIPGKLSGAPPGSDSGNSRNREVDDVLDELCELALRTGSEVVVVPTERMPTQTGAAAVYRY